jgi:hypothetical protein
VITRLAGVITGLEGSIMVSRLSNAAAGVAGRPR